jgi:hypothetical protein
MHKALETLGKSLPTGWLKMSVELGGELNQPICLKEIESYLHNTLKSLNLSLEGATYIMQGGHTKPTTIVTYYVPKKTHEKNGQQ